MSHYSDSCECPQCCYSRKHPQIPRPPVEDLDTGMELRGLAADLMRERDSLRAELAKVREERDECRKAREATLCSLDTALWECAKATLDRLDCERELEAARSECQTNLREIARVQARAEKTERERDELTKHHLRVVDQRNRDWDALMVLLAKAIGIDEDREAAEMGEVDEFDPWHALRTFTNQRDTAIRERDEAVKRAEEAEENYESRAGLLDGIRGTCENLRRERDELRERLRVEFRREYSHPAQQLAERAYETVMKATTADAYLRGDWRRVWREAGERLRKEVGNVE